MFYIASFALLNFLHVVSSQSPPSENVVIVQPSSHLLQCPIPSTDCSNVQWNHVTSNGAVYMIGKGQTVYSQYQENYQINSTAGYCMLNILRSTADNAAGIINCIGLDDGNPVMSFHIYTIANGPNCSANVQSINGYAMDGETLTYTCDLTYSGGGAGGHVEMTWFNSKMSPLPEAVAVTRGTGNDKHITVTHDVVANKPYVPQFVCRSSFGNKNGSMTAVIQDCIVKPVYVKYAVTSVKVLYDGGSVAAGSNVTCVADGIPPPNIRWMDLNSGVIVVNDSVFLADRFSSETYYCEAFNEFNDQPIRSASIVFNNTLDPNERPVVKATPAWIVPVVICIPVIVLLIIIVTCLICPCCPVNKTIKNRSGKLPVKDKMRSIDRLDGPSGASVHSSPLVEYHADIMSAEPQPRPRSSLSNRNALNNSDSLSNQGSLTHNVPPPKKPLLSGAGAGIATNELLYADIASPSSSEDGSRRPRPYRPGPKPQSQTIYTPVVRS